MTLVCTRCGKRLSRKHARIIEGKPMHAGCMFGNAKVDAHPQGGDGLPGSVHGQRGDAEGGIRPETIGNTRAPITPSDRSQRAVVEADDIVTLDVFLAAYADCSDGEVIASVIEPTDDLLTLGCLRRILAALQPPAADNATRTEDGLPAPDFTAAFDLIFEAYSKPADQFHNYEAWALWQHGKVIKAFGHMQKARTALRTTGQPAIAAADNATRKPVGEADV